MSEPSDQIPSIKKWVTDASGRTVYYPYGPAWNGYVVTDPAREQALRTADERFAELGKRLRPFWCVLLALLIYACNYYAYRRPVVMFAIIGSTLPVLALLGWLLHRLMTANHLIGLVRVNAVRRIPCCRLALIVVVP